MNDSNSQRKGFKLWQIALVLAISGILAGLLFPFFGRSNPPSRRSSCQSNLKQIMLGIKQYVQDYDEKFPLVATGKPDFGWAATLQPYLKSTQIFQCPSEGNAGQSDPTQLGYTDYWFNARLAGTDESTFENQSEVITLGDGNDGHDSTDAQYHLFAIPQRWRGDENSPLYRHLGGANLAFDDGHTKWFKADAWKDGTEAEQGYSLAPKLAVKPTR